MKPDRCYLVIISQLILAILGLSCSGTHLVLPGKTAEGRMRLPNGWYISPAGKQIEVGDAPLNFDIDPDGNYAIVTNNGAGNQTVCVVDLKNSVAMQSIPVQKAWLGIKFYNDGKNFALSGGNDNRILLYSFEHGKAALADSIIVGKPWPNEGIWMGGIDIDEAAHLLYVTGKYDSTFYCFDLATKALRRKVKLPGVPFTCLVSKKHPQVYLSLWGSSSVLVFDGGLNSPPGTIAVGPHPNDMTESPDGKRLYIANANENSVSVIDIGSMNVTETIISSLFPDALPGSTPNSVALSQDGNTLYIANADNNYVAVMDVSSPGRTRSLGFIPSGWYPSCVRINHANGDIIVTNAKGNSSFPNPQGPRPGHKLDPTGQYIAWLLKGTLEIVKQPSPEELHAYSAQVYGNTPYRRDTIANKQEIARLFSPIKHVFYVIKENRTYDQILGDMPEGNGDSSLTIFGEKVTPNLHALARQFVLLDNFYVDAEVSADGHNWSDAAYATDYVEKTWPTMYGDRGGDYDFGPDAPISSPSSGYIWDNCKAHNVTYRDYGEEVNVPERVGDPNTATTAGLEGHVCQEYRGFDMNYSELDREAVWEKEFDAFERDGGLPQFNIVYFPNDHTNGTAKGKGTPRAYAAQNDLAVGRFIERLSQSRYWKESAVFIVEDDAQAGPDHIDAHRSTAYVISPYTKHRYVDHTMYSTSGLVGTMERILGLPPMTQYDAAATPMVNSFTADADFSPYTCIPAIIDLKEQNPASAYGAKESEKMNFSRPDEIDEALLNEILWRSIKGAEAPVPAPRHGAWVMVEETKED
jgi:YVTN family beta-propeller protein